MTAERPEAGGPTALPGGPTALPGERGWLMIVHTRDRPGALSALSAVFSSRGVSFDSVSTGPIEEPVRTIALSFRATPRRAMLLDRAVQRLALVTSTSTVTDDDPAVLAAGVVLVPPGGDWTPPPEHAGGSVRWCHEAWSAPALVSGTFAAVRAAVARARADGCGGGGIIIVER